MCIRDSDRGGWQWPGRCRHSGQGQPNSRWTAQAGGDPARFGRGPGGGAGAGPDRRGRADRPAGRVPTGARRAGADQRAAGPAAATAVGAAGGDRAATPAEPVGPARTGPVRPRPVPVPRHPVPRHPVPRHPAARHPVPRGHPTGVPARSAGPAAAAGRGHVGRRGAHHADGAVGGWFGHGAAHPGHQHRCGRVRPGQRRPRPAGRGAGGAEAQPVRRLVGAAAHPGHRPGAARHARAALRLGDLRHLVGAAPG